MVIRTRYMMYFSRDLGICECSFSISEYLVVTIHPPIAMLQFPCKLVVPDNSMLTAKEKSDVQLKATLLLYENRRVESILGFSVNFAINFPCGNTYSQRIVEAETLV